MTAAHHKLKIRAALFTLAPLLLIVSSAFAADNSLIERPQAQQFIDMMMSKHQFERAALTQLLSETELSSEIIKAITRPYESKPWHQYRPIFVTQKRIKRGLEFWQANSETLARAEKEYGVPPEIITAIIGVESFYGVHKGRYRVLDALTTLGFDYPKRGKFFRRELAQYLLLTREEGVDPRSIKGSYAGAMGQPQFIASSYRAYAVDFNDDGIRDLWDSTEDVIGSVANYFRRHGWQQDQPIASRAKINDNGFKKVIKRSLKPTMTVAQFNTHGVALDASPAEGVTDATKATLIELKNESTNEYWLGYRNFYVISRYNHSALYSMAVFQLATELRNQHDAARTNVN